MNGTRSIFMRKGYWLTALAAIVLLAASPGTAQAQLTSTDHFGDRTSVTEGDDRHVYRGHRRDISRLIADQRTMRYRGLGKSDLSQTTITVMVATRVLLTSGISRTRY